MKKLFLVLAAAFAMVACQTDINEVGVVADGVATVEFEVGAPQMRSYSDGLTATKLQYAVYEVKADKSLNYLQNLTVAGDEAKTLVNGAANVKIELANNKKYAVIFWASAAVNAPYTFNPAEKTVTVDYNNAECNDESRDAFYAYKEFEVKGAATLGVELRRPFAQVNVGTSDLAEAAKSNFVPETSALVVKNVCNVLNLVTGEATGGVDATFEAKAIPTGEAFPYDNANYDYLAMSYVLIGKSQSTNDVTYTITAEDNTVITNTIGAVPMQANYRTNIYGKLLTSTTDINVEIKPGYEEPANGYYITEDGGVTTLHVTSIEGIEAIAEGVATGDSQWTDANIVLDTDLDLAATTRSVESNWTPIGTDAIPFTGSLDGNGNTIKNLTIVETEAKEGKAFIGFFGYAKNATIKNVVFENVYINIPCLDIDHSQGHIGAVAGSLEGTSTIENVTVKGDIKVYATQEANGASRVAVIAGGNSYGNVTMENVHVIANAGSYLIANNNAGALAGQLQGKSVCKNCSSNINVTVNKFFAGGLIGLAAGDQLFENCHTTGDIAVVAGREGRAHDQYRVGGIAGGWADGPKNVCTLVNCSYTGKVSGKNSDGSVAEPLDYLGYVGRGYTLNGCQGSKVVIDGTEFVQKYNTADEAGVYTVTNAEGRPVALVKNAEELQAALDNAKKGDVIRLASGNYGKLYLRPTANTNVTKNVDWIGNNYRYESYSLYEDITILGTTGTVIDAIEIEGGTYYNTNHSQSATYPIMLSLIELKNFVIEGVTFTGNGGTDPQGYGNAVNLSGQNIKVNGLTLKNCILNNDANNARLLYKTEGTTHVHTYTYDGETYTFTPSLKDITVTDCTFNGGYMGLELREAENVTITNNVFKVANRNILLPVNAGCTYSGAITITGNTSINAKERFVRADGTGDAVVVIKNNTITNYQGSDTDYIKVTNGNNVTIENNTLN